MTPAHPYLIKRKMKQRIVLALGGNALGNNLPEQMKAVQSTAHTIADLIARGTRWWSPTAMRCWVGMIQQAFEVAARHEPKIPSADVGLRGPESGLHRL